MLAGERDGGKKPGKNQLLKEVMLKAEFISQQKQPNNKQKDQWQSEVLLGLLFESHEMK